MAIVKSKPPAPAASKKRLTAIDLQMAVADHYDWSRNHIFLNVYLGGGEMDVAVITRGANYLWEFEIKVTLADWKKDALKHKWDSPQRRMVSRFFYVIPESLVDKVPDFVSPETGIVTVKREAPLDGLWEHSPFDLSTNVVRLAKKTDALQVDNETILILYKRQYLKYWRNQCDAFSR